MNFQPVIPMTLTPKLNLISRVVLPIISQQDITREGVKQSGIGDVVASLAVGPRFVLASPSNSKADFGVRAVLVLAFPK